MEVQNATPAALLQGTKQYRVPIWQRQYTWRGEQHGQLWRDLLHQYDLLLVGGPPAASGHFLGSFVLAPVSASGSGVITLLVIDGQQRLTTLMLLLCALRDALAETEPGAVDELNDTYLINRYKPGEQHYRLRPTLEDRDSFIRWVEREPDAAVGDGISEAYRYFRRQLAREHNGQPLDLRLMIDVVAERLSIVEINTGQGDNAHRIFQSLNGTGVELNKADLLRNYVFMLLPTQSERVYEQVWRPMEQLVGVENLEGLARVDLQRRGINVTKDDIFRLHQARLAETQHDEAAIEAEVRDLARRGRHYKRLIDPSAEPDPELRTALGRLGTWGAQTSHPVLMVALDLQERGVIAVEDVRRVVGYVESYLVRRQLAKVAPNALNKIFIALIGRLPADASFADAFHRELSRDRLDWPDDDWIAKAVTTQRFFETGRWHQRKLILEQLEQSYEHPEHIDFESSDFQIEHVMPQTLSPLWRQHLEALGQDPDEVHHELVHTLGNLTLTAFNGTLSNHPFERKQQIYGESHLELNRALTEGDSWGRDEILARAADLVEQIAAIWPAPLPGISDLPGGSFDWTRVDAAIAAIPTGSWISYAELAVLGGTAAQPVGNHVMALGAGTNAYRVLSADGRISEQFVWDDDRDVRDVLINEGITFDAAGRADPECRITAAELVALTETPEDELDDEDIGDLDAPAAAA